jgi:hypothetical protein
MRSMVWAALQMSVVCETGTLNACVTKASYLFFMLRLSLDHHVSSSVVGMAVGRLVLTVSFVIFMYSASDGSWYAGAVV